MKRLGDSSPYVCHEDDAQTFVGLQSSKKQKGPCTVQTNETKKTRKQKTNTTLLVYFKCEEKQFEL